MGKVTFTILKNSGHKRFETNPSFEFSDSLFAHGASFHISYESWSNGLRPEEMLCKQTVFQTFFSKGIKKVQRFKFALICTFILHFSIMEHFSSKFNLKQPRYNLI